MKNIGEIHVVICNTVVARLIYGKPILSERDVISAINQCHANGIPTVIVSSSRSFSEAADAKTKLNLFASSIST